MGVIFFVVAIGAGVGYYVYRHRAKKVQTDAEAQPAEDTEQVSSFLIFIEKPIQSFQVFPTAAINTEKQAGEKKEQAKEQAAEKKDDGKIKEQAAEEEWVVFFKSSVTLIVIF